MMSGATLSKGLNRGIGTVLGGGLGYLSAAFAQAVGGIGKGIVVGIAVFVFGNTSFELKIQSFLTSLEMVLKWYQNLLFCFQVPAQHTLDKCRTLKRSMITGL